MMDKKIKLVAFDLDGTLTQHKTPLDDTNRAVLEQLSKHYKLVMVGAGNAMRIFNQLGGFPMDVMGNYGMQLGLYNPETKTLDLVRNDTVPCDRESVDKRITMLRERFGFTEYAGENVEFHDSGCVTFPILGTKAKAEDKLAFDPDRSKRRKIYDIVVETFPEFVVFVGGSSSFDMAPRPRDKYYALSNFCKELGLSHDEVAYAGDDYGPGGNDESIYKSDIRFYCVDDYTKLGEYLKELL
ncbi:MAG: HAD-IIB family hydrolase [Oscillospiraceae bacterium]|nr:HAD-IIB family hydrolase [Oscillospiraceae bacterium]